MRRARRSALAAGLAALLAVAGCTAPAPTPEPQPTSSAPSVAASPTADAGVVVTFLVAGSERYRIRLIHQDDIEIARRLLAGEEAPGIPNGRLMRGVTDVTVGHAWSIDPDDVEFADSTIELCDGLPSQIDRGEFSVDRYCPWSAKVVAIDPAP